MPLERGRALEAFSGPEPHPSKPQRHSIGRYSKACMHQQATQFPLAGLASLVVAAIDGLGEPNLFWRCALEQELSGILQDQHGLLASGNMLGKPLRRGRKMACHHPAFADLGVVKEPVGCLCRCPVATRNRDRFSKRCCHRLHQAPESSFQPLIA